MKSARTIEIYAILEDVIVLPFCPPSKVYKRWVVIKKTGKKAG